MMRKLIAAIVAGILIMVWQTSSHTFLNLHASQETYTPNEKAILQSLSENLTADGQYYLPGVPPGTPMENMQQLMDSAAGKPYASIIYHQKMDTDMTGNILRGLGTNIVLGFVLVWLLAQLASLSFGKAVTVSLAIGIMAFMLYPYPGYIWYKTSGIWVEMLDALAAFALAGIWLGWYLPKGKKA